MKVSDLFSKEEIMDFVKELRKKQFDETGFSEVTEDEFTKFVIGKDGDADFEEFHGDLRPVINYFDNGILVAKAFIGNQFKNQRFYIRTRLLAERRS